MKSTLGIIGGRGYTGRELLGLLAGHEQLEVVAVASRSQAGMRVIEVAESFNDKDLCFCDAEPAAVFAHPADAYVLALPNGQAAEWVAHIKQYCPAATIVDLSADYRTDPDWIYGLPEIHREQIRGARRIANPGCYATATALCLWPYRNYLRETPSAFGLSGYSGAGSTPSPRNDPRRLNDNIIPYQLTGHAHQRELSHLIGHEVALLPHVTPFFRGLVVTVTADLNTGELDHHALLHETYAHEPLVRLLDEPAEPGREAGCDTVALGPVQVDPRDSRRIVMTAALDNLRKGAATQALQNLNLALGYPELRGISAGAAA